MLPLLIAPDLERCLILLTQDEIESPFAIVDDYCNEFKPGETRDMLNGLIRTALLSDDQFNLMGTRSDLILWGEQTARALESFYAIAELLNKNPSLKKQLCS